MKTRKSTFLAVLFAILAVFCLFTACKQPAEPVPQVQTVAKPTATPAGSNYVSAQTVTLTAGTTGTDIHYTLDGTDPTASSTLYSSAITINETTTLKAIAVKTGWTNSDILTETYTIGCIVIFDADGGTPAPISPVTMPQGNTITQPPTMTKAWHTFGGWYMDSAYTVSAIFPITVNGNVNLYARWIVNTISSVDDVKNYLTSLPNNTINNPASLTININLGTMTAADSGWQQLLEAINTAGKYVNLDLSSCTMTGTSFNPVSGVATGKDRIVSIILPTVATDIPAAGSSSVVFNNFSSLKFVSGTNINTIGSVESYTFYGCTSLQSVSFPQLLGIGGRAFYGCSGLQSVDFPQATIIRNAAFYGCSGLQSVNFPQATFIEIYAFYGCTSLQNVSFPLVTSIGTNAFKGCTSLQSVNIPQAEGLFEIPFDDCTSLQSVNLPASVTIYENPFTGCTSLTSFTLSGSGALSVIENGRALVQNGAVLIAYPSASGTITTMNAITSIGASTFSGCTGLQSISLPQVTSIESAAFAGCTSLQSLYIPKVTSIGLCTFEETGTATLSITMGPTAPTLRSNMFSPIFGSPAPLPAKTVMVKIPTGAIGYSPASSPFSGTAVTVSGTDTAANWGNGFRGGGWNGSTWDGDTSYIKQNISVIIERQ